MKSINWCGQGQWARKRCLPLGALALSIACLSTAQAETIKSLAGLNGPPGFDSQGTDNTAPARDTYYFLGNINSTPYGQGTNPTDLFNWNNWHTGDSFAYSTGSAANFIVAAGVTQWGEYASAGFQTTAYYTNTSAVSQHLTANLNLTPGHVFLNVGGGTEFPWFDPSLSPDAHRQRAEFLAEFSTIDTTHHVLATLFHADATVDLQPGLAQAAWGTLIDFPGAPDQAVQALAPSAEFWDVPVAEVDIPAATRTIDLGVVAPGATIGYQYSMTVGAYAGFDSTVMNGRNPYVRAVAGDPATIGAADMPLISLTAAPVPEPETWVMLLAGLGLVGWLARRRG